MTGLAEALLSLAKSKTAKVMDEAERLDATPFDVAGVELGDGALIEQLRDGYAEMSKPALVRDCAAVAREQGSEP